MTCGTFPAATVKVAEIGLGVVSTPFGKVNV